MRAGSRPKRAPIASRSAVRAAIGVAVQLARQLRHGRLRAGRHAEGALVGGQLDDAVDAGDLRFAADIGLDREDARGAAAGHGISLGLLSRARRRSRAAGHGPPAARPAAGRPAASTPSTSTSARTAPPSRRSSSCGAAGRRRPAPRQLGAAAVAAGLDPQQGAVGAARVGGAGGDGRASGRPSALAAQKGSRATTCRRGLSRLVHQAASGGSPSAGIGSTATAASPAATAASARDAVGRRATGSGCRNARAPAVRLLRVAAHRPRREKRPCMARRWRPAISRQSRTRAAGGSGAGVAGQQAAEDQRLPPRAQRAAVALGAAGGQPGDHRGAAHQQVVQGVVERVDLGARGRERARWRRCRGGIGAGARSLSEAGVMSGASSVAALDARRPPPPRRSSPPGTVAGRPRAAYS